MDLSEVINSVPEARHKPLKTWLKRFLTKPDSLSIWVGTWTEVNTAKILDIYIRRGVVEELEEKKSGAYRTISRAILNCTPVKIKAPRRPRTPRVQVMVGDTPIPTPQTLVNYQNPPRIVRDTPY